MSNVTSDVASWTIPFWVVGDAISAAVGDEVGIITFDGVALEPINVKLVILAVDDGMILGVCRRRGVPDKLDAFDIEEAALDTLARLLRVPCNEFGAVGITLVWLYACV